MHNGTLVSIIIPVYNTEKYLRKCVDSVRNQTYQKLEIWLVNDGSADSSGAICDEYARMDSRIAVIHQANAGQGAARNVALDRCSGEYIAFVDSDDWIAETFVEQMVQAIEEFDADICICGYYAHTGIRTVDIAHVPRVLDGTYDIMKHAVSSKDITTMPWDKLYRRCLLESNRFPFVRANEDAYLLYDILQECKRIVVVGECLYHQFIRPGSTERSDFSDKNYALIGAAEKLMAIVKHSYPDLYPYVQFKAADDMYGLLYKIVRSGKSASNEQHYTIINEKLMKELKRIKDTEEVSNQEKWAQLDFSVRNVDEAKRRFRKRACRDCIIRQLKQIVLKLKGLV